MSRRRACSIKLMLWNVETRNEKVEIKFPLEKSPRMVNIVSARSKERMENGKSYHSERLTNIYLNHFPFITHNIDEEILENNSKIFQL